MFLLRNFKDVLRARHMNIFICGSEAKPGSNRVDAISESSPLITDMATVFADTLPNNHPSIRSQRELDVINMRFAALKKLSTNSMGTGGQKKKSNSMNTPLLQALGVSDDLCQGAYSKVCLERQVDAQHFTTPMHMQLFEDFC